MERPIRTPTRGRTSGFSWAAPDSLPCLYNDFALGNHASFDRENSIDGPIRLSYGSSSMPAKRHGLTAAGNWIVDRVKIIDVWPQEERLAQIVGETSGGGGGAHNVLVDLALMKAPFPLRAVGVVGNDEDGKWLMAESFQLGTDISGIRTSREQPP